MTPDEFWSILQSDSKQQPVFYRAYYNEHNVVNCYTMEDLPGNYIDIPQEIYVLTPPARIVNGKLVVIKPSTIVTKLHPGQDGTPCHPTDVCIVVDPTNTTSIKWTVK